MEMIESRNKFAALVAGRMQSAWIACFHGFRFVFVNDHVDIYLLKRKYDCTKLLDLEQIKVYPP